MPTLTPGTTAVWTEPVVYYVPLGADLPHINTRYIDCLNTRDFIQSQVPTAKEIRDTVNGIVVTPRNPVVGIQGERFGRNRSIPSGDDGVSIGLQSLLPQMDFIRLVNSLATQSLSATAYVLTLTITAGATANGNVTVTLPGLAPVVIPVLASDTTPAQIATKIRAGTFTGWTTGGTGAVVTFTKTTAGYVAGTNQTGTVTFDTNTGTGTFSTTPTTWGRNAADSDYVQKGIESRFMLLFVGKFEAGGLYDTDKQAWGFGYAVRNTANSEQPHRWTGADAPWRPSVTLECESYPLTSAQVAKSGTSLTEHDKAGKFTYFTSSRDLV